MIQVGNFTLAPGNSSLIIPLIIPDDDYVENDEQFTLIISQPNTTLPPITIPITITDNDCTYTSFPLYFSCSVILNVIFILISDQM